MTKPFATVIIFCLFAMTAYAGDRDAVPHDPTASCAQTIKATSKKSGQSAARESAFFNVAEKYGIISAENSLGDDKRTAYFNLMQVYSKNLVASPQQFCEALIKALTPSA